MPSETIVRCRDDSLNKSAAWHRVCEQPMRVLETCHELISMILCVLAACAGDNRLSKRDVWGDRVRSHLRRCLRFPIANSSQRENKPHTVHHDAHHGQWWRASVTLHPMRAFHSVKGLVDLHICIYMRSWSIIVIDIDAFVSDESKRYSSLSLHVTYSIWERVSPRDCHQSFACGLSTELRLSSTIILYRRHRYTFKV